MSRTGLASMYADHELIAETNGGLLLRTGSGETTGARYVRRRLREFMSEQPPHERARAKGRVGSGEPPFGYTSKRGKMVRHEGEQAALARIRDLRASGVSIRGIAATLTSEGHKPRGKAWHVTTVARLVRGLDTEGSTPF